MLDSIVLNLKSDINIYMFESCGIRYRFGDNVWLYICNRGWQSSQPDFSKRDEYDALFPGPDDFAFATTCSAASQTSVSFQGMITEAVCHISTSHGNISSSCTKQNAHHTASYHVSSVDNQTFALPGNVGHMQLKWLNAARTKGLLVAFYR